MHRLNSGEPRLDNDDPELQRGRSSEEVLEEQQEVMIDEDEI